MYISYWDIDNQVHYEIDQYCQKYECNKDELLELIKLAYKNSADFHYNSDTWQEKIDEAYEKGRDSASTDEDELAEAKRDSYNEGYEDGKKAMEENIISLDKHEQLMKERGRNEFIRGFKMGTDWVPAPTEFPELKGY